MKQRKHHPKHTSEAPRLWSYSNVVAIAVFAGVATYVWTSAYAEQAQIESSFSTVAASQPAGSSSLPIWATLTAVILPFAVLLPISLIKKQREQREMLIHELNLHGPVPTTHHPAARPIAKPKKVATISLPKTKTVTAQPPAHQVDPAPNNAPVTPPEVVAQAPREMVPPSPLPQPPPRPHHQPGGIPANDLGIGVSLKDMVIKSIREQNSKNTPKS